MLPVLNERCYRRFRQFVGGCLCLSFCGALAWAAEPPAVSIGYQEAENLALRHNAQIQNARAMIDGAQADILTAGARPNAVMSVNGSGIDKSQYSKGAKLNAVDTIVRVDQPFERGNKRDLRLAKAGDLNQAALWDLQETIRQERMRVVSRLVGSARGRTAFTDRRRQLAPGRARRGQGPSSLQDGGSLGCGSRPDRSRLCSPASRSTNGASGSGPSQRHALQPAR